MGALRKAGRMVGAMGKGRSEVEGSGDAGEREEMKWEGEREEMKCPEPQPLHKPN